MPAVATELWQFPAPWDREVTVLYLMWLGCSQLGHSEPVLWRQDKVVGSQSELGPSGYICSVCWYCPWIQMIQVDVASSRLGLWINQMDTSPCCVLAHLVWLDFRCCWCPTTAEGLQEPLVALVNEARP